MPDDAPRLGTPSRATLAVLAGLFLGTLAMRPQLVGIGPLLPQIQDDLGVSFGVVGLNQFSSTGPGWRSSSHRASARSSPRSCRAFTP